MASPTQFENYELLRREDGSVFELGRGAMGVTYKAFDSDLHCHVAVKVINPGILGNADARERFLREARAAAKLRHPNIATVFRLGHTDDGTHYYAMEFCEGPTLDKALAQRGPFPAVEAVRVAWQVSKALILAEEHKLLHRDLKPSNLILTERRDEGIVVKVIDFGLAKSFADGEQSLATMSTGGFVGTAQFASPEQLEEKELDIRSDIYSLGMCLWYMLAGHLPFEGSLARVMSQTLTAEPPWAALDGQPEPVVALLRKMLAKDRENRPPTAVALRKELEACLQSLAAPVPGTSVPGLEKTVTASLDDHAFGSRFQMRERIGRDSLGRIFRATDTMHGNAPVAVHVIESGFIAVPALRREVEERVVVAMAHPHPNLLAPLAYCSTAGSFLIATPWTDGFKLLDLLKHRGALTPAEMLRVIEPLARAASHAAHHRIAGFDLSKEQTVVHFPGGLGDAERTRLPTEPLRQWPEFEIKTSVLSIGELGAEGAVSLASMLTLAPGTRSAATLPPVSALAWLACELLGGSGNGEFAPISRLSENANAVLRGAIADGSSFPSPISFVDALRTAIGSAGTAVPPRVSAPPVPALPPTRPPLRLKKNVLAVLAFIAMTGLGAGYWFGIHRPRERDREKREADAEIAAKDVAEKQRLAKEENERIVAEAQKARVETEKIKTEQEKQRLAISVPAGPSSVPPDSERAMKAVFKEGSVLIPTTVSVTRDGRYGVLGPDWEHYNETQGSQNLFVETRTGRVLATLTGETWVEDRTGAGRQRNQMSLQPQWSADGSVFAWVLGGKWSPSAFTLLKIQGGNVEWQLDVLTSVQQEILSRTKVAVPKNYDAARTQNKGSGSAYPDGFTIGVEAPRSGFSLPLRCRITLTSNPKEISNWPEAANVRSSLDAVIEPTGKITYSAFAVQTPGLPATLPELPAPQATAVNLDSVTAFVRNHLDLEARRDWNAVIADFAQRVAIVSMKDGKKIRNIQVEHGELGKEKIDDAEAWPIQKTQLTSPFNTNNLGEGRFDVKWRQASRSENLQSQKWNENETEITFTVQATGSHFNILGVQTVVLRSSKGTLGDIRQPLPPFNPPSSISPNPQTLTPQKTFGGGKRYNGKGTVYKIPDLKNLVGQKLQSAWLYGDFVYESHNGNIGTFMTAALFGAVAKGATCVYIESGQPVFIREETVRGRADYLQQNGILPEITIHVQPSDPLELLSVSRDTRGRLIVRTRTHNTIGL